MSSFEIREEDNKEMGSKQVLPGDPSLENVVFVMLGVVSMLAVILHLYFLFS